jgi:hypothetical protein
VADDPVASSEALALGPYDVPTCREVDSVEEVLELDACAVGFVGLGHGGVDHRVVFVRVGGFMREFSGVRLPPSGVVRGSSGAFPRSEVPQPRSRSMLHSEL